MDRWLLLVHSYFDFTDFNVIAVVHSIIMAAIETLKDCISRLPAAVQNQQVSKLHEIAESFTNWQSVVPYLGLDETQEESIATDHSRAAIKRFVAVHICNIR